MDFVLLMAHRKVISFLCKKWFFSFESSQVYMEYFQQLKVVCMDRILLLETNIFFSNTRNNKITQTAETKKIAVVGIKSQ